MASGRMDGGSSGGINEKRRLEDYDEAMRRIKDATGVSDVNEIIQKKMDFSYQKETVGNINYLTISIIMNIKTIKHFNRISRNHLKDLKQLMLTKRNPYS
jgi:hypothetical protein